MCIYMSRPLNKQAPLLNRGRRTPRLIFTIDHPLSKQKLMATLKIVKIKITEKDNTVIVFADDVQIAFTGITSKLYGSPKSDNTSCWMCLDGNHQKHFEAITASHEFEIDPRDISRPDEQSGHRGGFIHPDDIKVIKL